MAILQDRVPEDYADFEPALHAAARAATGLSEFGDDGYLTGLRKLIEAYAKDLVDDAENRENAFALTLPALVGRLHSERGWAEHPGCLQTPIRRPLIIAGIPRTGTTALHMLLALDTQFQGLESWIIGNPIVRPPRSEWQAHPLYRAAVERTREVARTNPKAMRIHGIQADDVDECLALMMQSCVTNQIPSLLDLPTYDDWYLAQDEADSYRRLADNLRLIGYREPHKIWLLKNPTHILRMRTLLSQFPDACIVHTHRDPVPTLASMCSVLSTFRGRPEPGPEAGKIGPRQVQVYKIAVEHTMAVRQQHPKQFHDVYQPELLADPMRVVRGIYEHFGLVLCGEAEARMHQWVADHPAGADREHRYRLDDFGLTAEGIRRELGTYIEHYGL